MSNNDETFQTLRGLGYNGTYNDMQKHYWSDQNALGRYSPASLFSSGEQGAWWDANDLSTLFEDVAMTVPASLNQPIAVQLDKSGNGHHRIQSTLGNRPILRKRNDGVLYLDYTGGKSISVPSSTADFKYLHDGTGGTLLCYIEWKQGLVLSDYLTNSSASTGSGMRLTKSTTGQAIQHYIRKSVSGQNGALLQTIQFAQSSKARLYGCTLDNSTMSSFADFPVTRYTTTPVGLSAADSQSDMAVHSTFESFEYEVIIRQGVLPQEDLSSIADHLKEKLDYRILPIDLNILCGGQSNMAGQGYMVSPPLSEDKLEGVYYYDKSDHYSIAGVSEHSIENATVATVPMDTYPKQGPSLRTGKKIKNNYNKNVMLVPCAVGGTSMAQWNTPLTLEDRTTLIGAMKYRWSVAKSRGGIPIIMYSGHESNVGLATPDYTNGGVGDDYKNTFISLMQLIRTEINDAPIFFTQLSQLDSPADPVPHAAAGEALRQVELELPNSYLIPMFDVKRNPTPDDIHVNIEGFDTVSDRFYMAIMDKIFNVGIDGIGPRLVKLEYSGTKIIITFDKEVNTSATKYGDLFTVYVNGVSQTINTVARGADVNTVEIVVASTLSDKVTVTYGYKNGLKDAARTDVIKGVNDIPTPVFGPLIVTKGIWLGPELFDIQDLVINNFAGGAEYIYNTRQRRMDITKVGTQTSYPRLRYTFGLTAGKTYRISGTLVGNVGAMYPVPAIRLHTSGTTNMVPYDYTTGAFGGDVVAGSDVFELIYDGTQSGFIAVNTLSIKEIL